MSDAAQRREQAARQALRAGATLAAISGFGVVVLPLVPWRRFPALGIPVGAAFLATLAWGLVLAVRANRVLKAGSVDVALDASGRRVTIRRVHPAFAAAADRHPPPSDSRS